MLELVIVRIRLGEQINLLMNVSDRGQREEKDYRMTLKLGWRYR